MPLRIILIFLLFFSNLSFSQDNIHHVRREIHSIICEADALLIDAKYYESLQLAKKGLNLAYENNQYDYIAMFYNTIAGCHEELMDINKALEYYKKALIFVEKTENDTVKDWVHNNIGNVYNFDLKDYQKGIYHYKKSLLYAEKRKDTAEIIFTKLNLASAYFNLKDFETGFPYLVYASKNLIKFKDVESDVLLNTLYGTYYNHFKNSKKADFYFKKAIEIGETYKKFKALSDAYEEYSKFLYNSGNYKNAYLNQKLFQELKDNIHNSEKIKNAQIAGVQIELDESKREINKIELERFKQAQNLKNSRITVFLFLAVLLGLLLFLYTLYRNNILRRKMNEQLSDSNAQLQIAKDKAEESSILKSQFISTVSHELRTPLYGVIGITDMILDEHKELKNSTHIKSLKFSAKYLLSLVNDLLQINKIEDRKIVLEETPLSVREEIEKVKDALQFIAVSNKNTTVLEIDKDIPEYLIGDKLRLSQILVNLISNALKFTKNGEIKLIAKLEKKVRNLHYVRFEINDNGCGIAIENQDKIFEKFVQINRKEEDYQGTGLGLSIVKKLLELMGSKIELESNVGKGTKMTFTIPFEYDEKIIEKIKEEKQIDIVAIEHYKILVVEDNKINQIVTRKILEKNDFECMIAEDGFVALEMLDEATYDLILMDINMPRMNGFETTKLIREKGIKIPIIALTAFDKDEIEKEALESGMDDVLIKPFEPALLFEIISNHILNSKK
ncbi:response regulator [uncultured Flavobacterium sp.]|uniref:response regulator n=1 Tax=uncultured Flavobacterium sp. TaxID=165435 RepID=UPI0025D51DF4|nr:response regulator [uncultured Flavobacterium sp.]